MAFESLPSRDHTGLKKFAVVSPSYFQERVWHYPEIKNMAFESLALRDHAGLKKIALVSLYYFRERAWHYRESKKIAPPPLRRGGTGLTTHPGLLSHFCPTNVPMGTRYLNLNLNPRDHTGLKKIALVSPYYFQERVWNYRETKKISFEALPPPPGTTRD
jgi:uncharacterized membrane protein